MRTLVPTVILLTLLASGCSGGKLVRELEGLIPAEVEGWTATESTAYDTGTIFDYMNGAGELFLSYAYRGMMVRRFERGDNELTAEIYDMSTGGDAYGIFSRFRSGEKVAIGQGACYVTGHLNLWRGRYYASVFALENEDGIRAEIEALGRAIAERIGADAPLPEILRRLPETDRDPESVRYFHLHTDLNRYWFVADENLLGLGPETEAALAAYELDADYPYLLLVRYPDAERAAAAAAAFRSAWMPEAGEVAIVQVEDGLWSALERDEAVVGIVFDSPDAERARALLEAAGF